jgi:mRNA interferase MazF
VDSSEIPASSDQGSLNPQFSQTGLKKTSLIRADKIVTVNESVFERQLGILPSDMLTLVQEALNKSLNIS